ncbi:MAG TPA: hypothetical protein VFH47_02290 [Candidatus Thermoplasmatota archaeon]|nr:hypothetical protein [Candidatus Thermoplasmatota archaeon]
MTRRSGRSKGPRLLPHAAVYVALGAASAAAPFAVAPAHRWWAAGANAFFLAGAACAHALIQVVHPWLRRRRALPRVLALQEEMGAAMAWLWVWCAPLLALLSGNHLGASLPWRLLQAATAAVLAAHLALLLRSRRLVATSPPHRTQSLDGAQPRQGLVRGPRRPASARSGPAVRACVSATAALAAVACAAEGLGWGATLVVVLVDAALVGTIFWQHAWLARELARPPPERRELTRRRTRTGVLLQAAGMTFMAPIAGIVAGATLAFLAQMLLAVASGWNFLVLLRLLRKHRLPRAKAAA